MYWDKQGCASSVEDIWSVSTLIRSETHMYQQIVNSDGLLQMYINP